MNKKLLAVTAIIIALIGGGFAYLMMQNDDEKSPESTTSTTIDDNTQTDNAAQGSAGVYADYSEQAVATTEGTKILFFHAPWCPQCRALESSIQESTIPGDVTIFKVDYDTNQALRQKYGVTIQTTLVKIDDQGNLVEKYVAYDEPDFAAVKENLLQ